MAGVVKKQNGCCMVGVAKECGCSMADYLEREHYMNKSWDTR